MIGSCWRAGRRDMEWHGSATAEAARAATFAVDATLSENATVRVAESDGARANGARR